MITMMARGANPFFYFFFWEKGERFRGIIVEDLKVLYPAKKTGVLCM